MAIFRQQQQIRSKMANNVAGYSQARSGAVYSRIDDLLLPDKICQTRLLFEEALRCGFKLRIADISKELNISYGQAGRLVNVYTQGLRWLHRQVDERLVARMLLEAMQNPTLSLSNLANRFKIKHSAVSRMLLPWRVRGGEYNVGKTFTAAAFNKVFTVFGATSTINATPLLQMENTGGPSASAWPDEDDKEKETGGNKEPDVLMEAPKEGQEVLYDPIYEDESEAWSPRDAILV